MTIVSETTLPLKNAIKDILLKIKNNETAMAMSGVGLGVAGAALSFPLFRYVGVLSKKEIYSLNMPKQTLMALKI